MSSDGFTAQEWQASSIRWLTSRHPEYVRSRGKSTWRDKLVSSLGAMSYQEAETVLGDGKSRDEYFELLGVITHTWCKKDHEAMIAFIASGGYAEKAKTMKTALPTFKTGAGDEEVALEFDEGALDDLEASARPKSQHSPQSELDEIIATAEVESDPRYKVW